MDTFWVMYKIVLNKNIHYNIQCYILDSGATRPGAHVNRHNDSDTPEISSAIYRPNHRSPISARLPLWAWGPTLVPGLTGGSK